MRLPLVAVALVAPALLVAAAAGGIRYATTPVSAGAIDPKAVPLGDGYVSTTPTVGYVDSCVTSFGGIGGAQAVGPWIDTTGKTWDMTVKVAVNGEVSWPAARYAVVVSGGKRRITFDDLPVNHTTGVFPIASSDPAYAYDRNPNQIAAQTLSWTLAANPTAAAKPSCTPLGPIGVLSDGVLLYNALDGEGRDAAAHEVLDACAGHPDMSSSYHHHDIPPCILSRDVKGKSILVGYALDGYGIYLTEDASGALPSNTALDACHGTTSVVPWNGKPTRIYRYVATLEYPYTVGCFHGTAVSSGRAQGPPPGGP
jgi:hypothetical protein